MHIILAHLLSGLLATRALAVAVPPPAADLAALVPRQPDSHAQDVELASDSADRHVNVLVNPRDPRDIVSQIKALAKRRGGGGSGGRGSFGGGGGRSGSGGSSSRTSSSSNAGGRTSTGSGPPPSYGGGRSYGGGSSTPYTAGSRSPSGIAPVLLGAGAASLLVWGLSAWPHGAYSYPYTQSATFYNATAQRNQTMPAVCMCDPTQECGCDDNTSTTYIESIIGDGSYASLNKTLVTVGKINGTDTLLINGTLPNGTTATGAGVAPQAGMLRGALWWPVLATLFAVVFASM